MATNREVAEAFGAGKVKEAEHFRSNAYGREGRSVIELYSYAMLIGRRWYVTGPDGKGHVVIWLNREKVSVTTSKHQSLATFECNYQNPDAIKVFDGVGQNPKLLDVLHAASLPGSHPISGNEKAGPLADWLLEQEEKKEEKTLWFHFSQNNSGGSWVGPMHVVIEARDAGHANERAVKECGLYFNGVGEGRDCSCCGDRWYAAQNEGEEFPHIYGDRVEIATTLWNDAACEIYPLVGAKRVVTIKERKS
jgi:hypothetical protein